MRQFYESVRTFPTVMGLRVSRVGSWASFVVLVLGFVIVYWPEAVWVCLFLALPFAVLAVVDFMLVARYAKRENWAELGPREGRTPRTVITTGSQADADGWLRRLARYRFIGRTGRAFSAIGAVLLHALLLWIVPMLLFPQHRLMFSVLATLNLVAVWVDTSVVTRLDAAKASRIRDDDLTRRPWQSPGQGR